MCLFRLLFPPHPIPPAHRIATLQAACPLSPSGPLSPTRILTQIPLSTCPCTVLRVGTVSPILPFPNTPTPMQPGGSCPIPVSLSYGVAGGEGWREVGRGEGRTVTRHRASSGVCVPPQLSEIAPAKHLLKISSLFLLVPVWVDFTRKEGVSLALCLPTPPPEPFRVPGPFLFTKLAPCQPFWGPPGLPCPLPGLVHVHGGGGQPSCIVDTWPLAWPAA